MARVGCTSRSLNENPVEGEFILLQSNEEVVMPSRFVLIFLVSSLLLVLFVCGCATERPLQKKAATSTGKERAEGQLEAIPPPVNPQKKVASPAETTPSYVQQEAPTKVEESDIASGYRVQIFASSSIEKAEEVAAKTKSLFTERIYVEYSAPLYRVRIGNFTSKEEALQFRDKIVQSGYEGAWVVEALIERE